jgi:hypothetical protein
MTLSPLWRRIVLTAHVVTSVGFLGAVAGFLALAIAGLVVRDPEIVRTAYSAMPVVTWFVILPLAFISLLIGVIQSLGTPWGLFRHYWVIVKLALTVLSIGVLMVQIPTIAHMGAIASTDAIAPSAFLEARVSLVVHAAGGILVLTAATVLSVFKPRGVTRYGAQAS